MNKLSNKRKELFEHIMLAMSELHRRFATQRDSFLAQFNISRPQLDVLFAVKHSSPTTGELAGLFSVTPSAVSQMVDQLEQKGLVTRILDQDDKRVTRVQLAPDTRKAFKDMRDQFVSHLSNKFCTVSDTELETLLQILNKTINQVDKEA
ncbi:MarR family transcriptional regulator [Candidatus Saccharibacteria bacterium]|nr:MarR family transcriptional regulator [Candidatus Saccharibacteria bacterium]